MKSSKSRETGNLSDTMMILGYGGTLPFIFLSLLMAEAVIFGAGLQSAAIFGLYAPNLFVSYSAIILSFLSGTLWDRDGSAPEDLKGNMILLVSNLLALTAWIALILALFSSLMTLLAVSLLIAGYTTMLLFERPLRLVYSRYWKLRLHLSAIVVAAHCLVMILLIQDS